MDFHSLARRELQNLSKKNKIPANITNVAMAHALNALEIVEGVEEFLKPSESETTAQSSIESPEKMEVTSPRVPRTGGRSSRRKTVQDEPAETFQTMSRTRRPTQKLVETPAVATIRRRVPAASARRVIDIQFDGIEGDHPTGKENKDIPETPAVAKGSHGQRGQTGGESMVKRVYGTRRSARVAERNMEDLNSNQKERCETVKSELFPKDSGDILETDVKEFSNDNPGEVSESAGIDLKQESEERMEKTNSVQAVSDIKSDYCLDNHVEAKWENDGGSNGNFEVVRSNIIVEQDGEGDRYDDVPEDADANDLKARVYEGNNHPGDIFDKPPESEKQVLQDSGFGDLYTSMTNTEGMAGNSHEMNTIEKMAVEDEDVEDGENKAIGHKTDASFSNNQTEKLSEKEFNTDMGDIFGKLQPEVAKEVLEVSGKSVLYLTKTEDTTAKRDEMFIYQQMVVDDKATEDVERKVIDHEIEEELDCNMDKDSGSSDNISLTEEVLEEDSKRGCETDGLADDIAALDTLDREHEYNEFGSHAPDELLSKARQGANQIIALESMMEKTNNSLTEESILNNLEEKYSIASECNERALIQGPEQNAYLEVVSEKLVAIEESSRNMMEDHFPSQPNTTKKNGHISDNKENIYNNGGIITNEKKKNHGIGQMTDYNQSSLRWLKKEFKRKLVVSQNLDQIEEPNMAATSRPALQKLPENHPAGEGEQ